MPPKGLSVHQKKAAQAAVQAQNARLQSYQDYRKDERASWNTYVPKPTPSGRPLTQQQIDMRERQDMRNRVKQYNERGSLTLPSQEESWQEYRKGERETGNQSSNQQTTQQITQQQQELHREGERNSWNEFQGDTVQLALQGTTENLLAQFMNYVTSAGWDVDNDGRLDYTVKDAVESLFKYVAGAAQQVTHTAEGVTPLTIELLKDMPGIGSSFVDVNTVGDAAYQLIETLQAEAERFGVDLGNIEGLSAEEVLHLYITQASLLAERKNWPGPLDNVANHWRAVALSFGVSPDLTMASMRWVNDNFPGLDASNPQVVEEAIRAYLEQEIRAVGAAPEDVNWDTVSLRDMTTWLDSFYDNTEDNFIQMGRNGIGVSDNLQTSLDAPFYTELYSEVSEEDTWGDVAARSGVSVDVLLALNDVSIVPGDMMNLTPQDVMGLYGGVKIPKLDMLEGMVLDVPYARDNAVFAYDADIYDQALPVLTHHGRMTAGLSESLYGAVLHNQYTSPPDLNLLIMIGSMIFEPVDWVVTGIEIINDIQRGDFKSAGINAGFMFAPFVSGWMDNVVFGVGRQIPSGSVDLIHYFDNPNVTRPSLDADPNALVGGRPKSVVGDFREIASSELENSNALALRRRYGYSVVQQPTPQELAAVGYNFDYNKSISGQKGPDFIIEGRVFDQYSPLTKNSQSIYDGIKDKVDGEQADRIVLDLTQNNMSYDEWNQFRKEWIEGDWSASPNLAIQRELNEIIVMQNGEIIAIWAPK